MANFIDEEKDTENQHIIYSHPASDKVIKKLGKKFKQKQNSKSE